MLGLTQQQMAELIGVTYQQAHKYETGINRISAGRLYQIAQALGVEISYFFEDVDPERRSKPKAGGDDAAAAHAARARPQLRRASAAASIRTRCATSPACWPTASAEPAAPTRPGRSLTARRAQRRGLADDPQRLRPEAERGQLLEREPARPPRRRRPAPPRPSGASAVKSTSV